MEYILSFIAGLVVGGFVMFWLWVWAITNYTQQFKDMLEKR